MDHQLRLDKYLADMSIGTRSEVKELIKDGKVKVNNIVIKKSDYKVNENDVVLVEEKQVSYVEYEYYILNKPSGYITALDDNRYPVVMELINSRRKDLVPVGRLDLDTEGLLLITNDGRLNHQLLSPKNHVDKKYYVEVDEKIIEGAEKIFNEPMDLGDFIAKPSKLEIINDHKAYLTIAEGKFHQVKRMFEKIGTNVMYLKRVSFGPLVLDIDIGKYRELTNEEIELLKNYEHI